MVSLHFDRIRADDLLDLAGLEGHLGLAHNLCAGPCSGQHRTVFTFELRTSPHYEAELDPFAVLVVAELHADVGVRRLVVAQVLAHLGNIACAG